MEDQEDIVEESRPPQEEAQKKEKDQILHQWYQDMSSWTLTKRKSRWKASQYYVKRRGKNQVLQGHYKANCPIILYQKDLLQIRADRSIKKQRIETNIQGTGDEIHHREEHFGPARNCVGRPHSKNLPLQYT